jgi:starch synthase (maltosyl-transferring)
VETLTGTPEKGALAERRGRERTVIERVRPAVDCGRFAVKRIVGDVVGVEADVFADGHDELWCRLLYRHQDEAEWTRLPMRPAGSDLWRGGFQVTKLGPYRFSVEAAVDPFRSWYRDLGKRIRAGEDVAMELAAGAALIRAAAERAGVENAADDAGRLTQWADSFKNAIADRAPEAVALDDGLAAIAASYPDRSLATRYPHELTVVVDRARARFSTWYEIFPRSCSPQQGRHGTLRDCESWLPYIAGMNFDVVYLPPIHPIGRQFRKGKNNSPVAEADDIGSPWAIGGPEGGHTSIHPQLGTLDDFRHFVEAAKSHGLEVALDIAFQATPDHPYVREHPSWFRKRPDGSIQYAENPPKKYEDIYPFDFESEDWKALWEELRQVFEFWIGQGIRIFRADNPHTKAFSCWEWVIEEIKQKHPDVLFLAEAFTRPHVMYRLAKLGFSQSYTYFAWRNTKQEITDYFTELTRTEAAEYLRPSLWPNTPDILPEFLQTGGRPAFMLRLILAATLGASYGIYGPAFELCENTPREVGSEEYLNAEKYELKHRDLNSPGSLKSLIARVNRIRRENPALQINETLRFHASDNPLVICFSKTSPDLSNVMIVVVNLDAFHAQQSWLDLDLAALGIPMDRPFQAHDLLSDARFLWQGPRNYVELTPESLPAHILVVRKRIRSEKDFDYYL